MFCTNEFAPDIKEIVTNLFCIGQWPESYFKAYICEKGSAVSAELYKTEVIIVDDFNKHLYQNNQWKHK